MAPNPPLLTSHPWYHWTRLLPTITPQYQPFLNLPGTIFLTGLDSPGKTTILHLLFPHHLIKTTTPVIGLPIESTTHNHTTLHTLSLGGGGFSRLLRSLKTRFPDLHKSIFDDCRGVIWVVDAGDRDRVVESREELMRLRKGGDYMSVRSGVPVLVVGNRGDSEGAMTVEEVTEKLFGGEGVQGVVKVQMCNALTGEGILEGLRWLEDAILRPVTVEMREKKVEMREK